MAKGQCDSRRGDIAQFLSIGIFGFSLQFNLFSRSC